MHLNVCFSFSSSPPKKKKEKMDADGGKDEIFGASQNPHRLGLVFLEKKRDKKKQKAVREEEDDYCTRA
jgi:hypothetical protein